MQSFFLSSVTVHRINEDVSQFVREMRNSDEKMCAISQVLAQRTAVE
jgi:hypothetical protein